MTARLMSLEAASQRHRDGLGIGMLPHSSQQPCEAPLPYFRAVGKRCGMGDYCGQLQDIARPIVLQEGLPRFRGEVSRNHVPGLRRAGRQVRQGSAPPCPDIFLAGRSGGMSMRTVFR